MFEGVNKDGKVLADCEKLLTKTIVVDMINDKKNGLGIQEREMLMYNYMMNQKMKKKDIEVKDIIDVKDSFLANLKSVN